MLAYIPAPWILWVWGFPKLGVPQNGLQKRESLLKWMMTGGIWGYPHFSKPPYMFWMVTDYEISCVVM